MAATEALAAVDTICVDKTGTLTDGELELVEVDVADPAQAATAERALARFAASAGERNRTLRGDRRALSGRRRARWRPRSRSPRSGSGAALTLNGSRRRAHSYVLGAPDVLDRSAGALELPPGSQRDARRAHDRGPAGRRLRRGPRRAAGRPGSASRRRGSSRSRSSCSRRRCAPTPTETIEFMREQEVDLKLISGDARETVTAVAHARRRPAGRRRDRGPGAARPTARSSAQVAERNTIFCRIRPEQKKALVARALRRAGGSRR